jgi:hypothetical protein
LAFQLSSSTSPWTRRFEFVPELGCGALYNLGGDDAEEAVVILATVATLHGEGEHDIVVDEGFVLPDAVFGFFFNRAFWGIHHNSDFTGAFEMRYQNDRHVG